MRNLYNSKRKKASKLLMINVFIKIALLPFFLILSTTIYSQQFSGEFGIRLPFMDIGITTEGKIVAKRTLNYGPFYFTPKAGFETGRGERQSNIHYTPPIPQPEIRYIEKPVYRTLVKFKPRHIKVVANGLDYSFIVKENDDFDLSCTKTVHSKHRGDTLIYYLDDEAELEVTLNGQHFHIPDWSLVQYPYKKNFPNNAKFSSDKLFKNVLGRDNIKRFFSDGLLQEMKKQVIKANLMGAAEVVEYTYPKALTYRKGENESIEILYSKEFYELAETHLNGRFSDLSLTNLFRLNLDSIKSFVLSENRDGPNSLYVTVDEMRYDKCGEPYRNVSILHPVFPYHLEFSNYLIRGTNLCDRIVIHQSDAVRSKDEIISNAFTMEGDKWRDSSLGRLMNLYKKSLPKYPNMHGSKKKHDKAMEIRDEYRRERDRIFPGATSDDENEMIWESLSYYVQIYEIYGPTKADKMFVFSKYLTNEFKSSI